MRTIFDIGMYDGADTEYYLESGYRVVAVEANPDLTRSAAERFGAHIACGRLTCVNVAISPDGEPVELVISGADLGSSSLFAERVSAKKPAGAIVVPGVTFHDLVERFGIPYYLKVDIEGADGLCIRPLSAERCPEYLSFEVGDDADELIEHVERIGFRRFRIVDQLSFCELAEPGRSYERVARRVIRRLGRADPGIVRRHGRSFVAGYSSGPLPWLTRGPWHSAEAVRRRLKEAHRKGTLDSWCYDVHAAKEP
jgi:FkbM family methyltransferase